MGSLAGLVSKLAQLSTKWNGMKTSPGLTRLVQSTPGNHFPTPGSHPYLIPRSHSELFGILGVDFEEALGHFRMERG